MLIHNSVKPEYATRLVEHFGEQKINRVQAILTKYLTEWELEAVELIPFFSVNVLFRVTSKQFGSAVLKIHTEVNHYTIREIAMLSSSIPLYCTCYLYNKEDGVILLKEVEQGNSLHQINALDKRLDAFLHVYSTIHVKPIEVHSAQYPSYKTLLDNIKAWASEHQVDSFIRYIDEAIGWYEELRSFYKDEYALHGDLHHDNILASNSGEYIVIDPKGVIDVRILDLPRFILNELEDKVMETDKQKIINIINYLSHKLNMNPNHLTMAFAIESLLSITWTLQDMVIRYKIEDILEQYNAEYLYCRSFMKETN